MPNPFFVSFDGPKGAGKSTLLDRVASLLSDDVSLRCAAEKDLDPYREATKRLLATARDDLTADYERKIAELLARGRAWVSRKVIPSIQEQVLLIDRWYPSEAALRRIVSFEECLALNDALDVIHPDLVIAVCCDPCESWRRARKRDRGYDSVVIRDYAQHCQSSRVFEDTAALHGWLLVHTNEPAQAIARTVCQAVLRALTARA